MVETRLYLLGELCLEHQGKIIFLRRRRKETALLAYLAVENQPVHRDELARIMKAEGDDNPRISLRKHIHRLKQIIGDELLDVNGQYLTLHTQDMQIDVIDFQSDWFNYNSDSANKDALEHNQLLKRCVDTYKGGFLNTYYLNASYEEWRRKQARELLSIFRKAIETFIVASYSNNELDFAIEYAHQWVVRDKENIRPHVWLVQLYELTKKYDSITEHFETFPLISIKRSTVEWKECIKNIAAWLSELNSYKFKSIFANTKKSTFSMLEQDKLKAFYRDKVRQINLITDPTLLNHWLTKLEEDASELGKSSEYLARFYLMPLRLRYYRSSGLYAKTLELLDEMDIYDPQSVAIDNLTRAAWYHHRAMGLCWIKGDYEQSRRELLQAREEYEQGNQMHAVADVYSDLGLVYWNMGRLRSAEVSLTHSETDLLKLKDDEHLMKVFGNLGLIHLYQGNISRARDYVTKHLRLANELNRTNEIKRAIGNRGVIEFHEGKYREAITDLEQDIALATNKNDEGSINAYINIIRCYAARGETGKAQVLAEDILERIDRLKLGRIKLIVLRAQAECLAPDKAVEALHEALSLAKENNREFDEAACYLSLYQLSEDTNYRQRGMQLLETMGCKGWLDQVSYQLPTL